MVDVSSIGEKLMGLRREQKWILGLPKATLDTEGMVAHFDQPYGLLLARTSRALLHL